MEVSHGATQMRLTPYRWESSKIEKAWIPEIAGLHDEETDLNRLVETLGLFRGQKEKENNIVEIMKLKETTIEDKHIWMTKQSITYSLCTHDT